MSKKANKKIEDEKEKEKLKENGSAYKSVKKEGDDDYEEENGMENVIKV